ncbi:ribonuclease T2-like [Saccostrea cucullata]|uniref:ribonuclease T2-like n=1 Tax=Saccostrea cuccullata TaxID=36930 RepID=UPI002ED10ABB
MVSSCVYMIFGILILSCHTTYLTAVEFDNFVLSFQWPVTFCKNQKCKQPLPAHWTVHGFWPSNSNGSFVKDCSKSPFTAESIPEGTINEMKRIWPDLLKSTKSTFWSYQWQKHGTCADVEDTRTVAQYFSKATELALLYNISAILTRRHIVGGNNFQVDNHSILYVEKPFIYEYIFEVKPSSIK